MFNNFNLRRGSAAVGVAIVLLLLGAITGIIGGDDPPADAGNDVCKDVAYVGIAPVVPADSIAFGPSIETRVTDVFTLTGADQVNAVTADELTVGCEYASQTLTQAIHRGIEAWPTSDQDWIDRLLRLDADREAQHELMGKVVKWQAEASAEVYYDPTPSYNSDWLERTGYGPMLRQGPGHDQAIGWVIKWTHVNADGTTSVVIERLTCMYQWVGEIPPTVPPPGTPPVVTPPTTTVPPGTTVPTATTTPTNTTVPSGTTVPTTVVPTSTTICGDKADRLPDGTCGLTATTVPRAPATVPASSTTRPTTPPTAPPDTLPAGVTPTTWDNVPTATTVQPKDGPPVVGTPQTTVAPMVTVTPTTNATPITRPGG